MDGSSSSECRGSGEQSCGTGVGEGSGISTWVGEDNGLTICSLNGVGVDVRISSTAGLEISEVEGD